ncbi:sodium/proton antiporter, CPA1 family [Micromonospora coriariae]|uniref:Sodium/proton antiporter, CPA1 family n=1 Tax=Micromonospora coriariae TaxID=285665 RepID=A0A1C4UIG1_9ACTN|nr:Na+/H+ antiporter [Micromonospora coriariae]SCE71473.1 sodium/proton antiporter, CPA1 family [Micromonospora coriariae]
MEALVLIVVLGVTVLVGTTLGGRYRVAPPVLLIAFGVLLGLAPPLSELTLEPDLVLLIFLPAILYRESLTISLREIRANFPVIGLLAVVLVVLTMVTVSLTAQAFGVNPAAAWVLGAVLAPTDAAAVTGLAKRLPRKLLTTLHAESLINDGTALVLFAVTVGLLTREAEPGALGIGEEFVGASAGGVIAGLLVGAVVVLVRKRLDDPLREGALSVLTPFTAFLLADAVHASGVLAVVVAGLVLAYAGPRVIRARSRVLAYAFWDLSTFLINGGLFVLLGTQIPRAVRGVTSASPQRALMIVLVVSVVVLVTRLFFVYVTAESVKLLHRRTVDRDQERGGWRVGTIAGWSGFRGAVSLAAALAVPTTTVSGQPVAERDLIIFVTSLVIVLIMLVQGTTLPLVVRWAGLVGDPERADELRQARLRATEVGLAALPQAAAEVGADEEAVRRLEAEYQRHLEDVNEGGGRTAEELARERQLRLAVLNHKRREITRLRDRREIDDLVLLDLQSALDNEEIRLLGRESTD